MSAAVAKIIIQKIEDSADKSILRPEEKQQIEQIKGLIKNKRDVSDDDVRYLNHLKKISCRK